MIRKISVYFALLAVVVAVGYAQSGVPVIVKGKVLDQYTNKPINVSMMFTDKTGKKFKITPNILSGEYQQVLNSGEEYEVTFISYDVIREKHSIRLEHSDKYLEIKQDFFPKRMTPGLEIYSENIFEHNSAKLTPKGTELLEGLAQAMKYSRGAKLLFNISAKDADKPANAKTLLDKRLNALSTHETMKAMKSRISYTTENNSNKHLSITVTEINDPLKN